MTLTTNSFNGNGAEKSAPLKTMKIKLLRNTRIDGEFAESGSTVEVDERDGNYLIANKIAEATTGKAKSKKSNKSDGLDVSDQKVGTRNES